MLTADFGERSETLRNPTAFLLPRAAPPSGIGGRRDPHCPYQPANQTGPLPAIVFSARSLRTRMAVRKLRSRFWLRAASSSRCAGGTAFFARIPSWPTTRERFSRGSKKSGLGDPNRLGLAGHSMGGKSSILAGLDEPDVRAVVAIDRDENGYTP